MNATIPYAPVSPQSATDNTIKIQLGKNSKVSEARLEILTFEESQQAENYLRGKYNIPHETNQPKASGSKVKGIWEKIKNTLKK